MLPWSHRESVHKQLCVKNRAEHMAVGTQEPQDCAGHGGGGKGVCGEPFTLDDCFFSPLGPVANFLP